MSFRPSRVLVVAKKEFLSLLRDRRIYPIVLVAPVLQLFLYGYAATFDLADLPVACIDADRSAESRALVRRIDASEDFDVAFRVESLDEAETLVLRGDAKVVLAIPPGFGRDASEGVPADVGLLLDGSDSNTATIARSSLEAIVGRRAVDLRVRAARERDVEAGAVLVSLESRDGVPEVLEMRTRVLYNPEMRSASFMVPGVVVMILLVMTMMLSTLAIVKEKEIGTFEMLLATPVRPTELIVGKLVPFVALGFTDVLIVLAVAALWFRVPVRGSVPLLLALSGAFVLTTIASGLLVSTVATSQHQAMVISFLAIVPQVLLSGLIFPVASMPRPMQVVSLALPIRHFLECVRAIFLRGVGLDVLLPQALALVGLGVALLAAAIARFRKTL